MHIVSLPGLISLLAVGSVGIGAASAESHDETTPAHVRMQRSLEARTWAAETRRGLLDVTNCTSCQSVLGLIKAVTVDNDDTFFSVAKSLCATSTDYGSDYCDGVIEREGPIIADIVKTMELDSPTAQQFCITFFGVCDYPKVDKWNVPFPSKKPCKDETAVAPSAKDSIQIIHYSDIHIDPMYQEGASTECKQPICCRPDTQGTPNGTIKTAGPNGDHNCDAPVTLEKSMYKAIKEMFPKAAFALFTGDIIEHELSKTTNAQNEKQIASAYDTMNEYIKLVYGTAGNHEANPANIFEPKALGNDTQWVYDTLSDEWSRWLDKDATKDVKDVGSYSTKYPGGNLRVISLNTNMYYRFNFVLYQKEMAKDPNDQIVWLVKELDAAEKAGENVYIIGHMPLGESDALTNGANYFDQAVSRYSSTIKAMFFGHTHVDHFEVSYSDYTKRVAANARAISYICPSLTPTSGMPSFRVYDVDPDTFAVRDATTYIADMSSSSFQSKDGPTWKKYYSAKEAYGRALSPPVTDSKAELTPAFWHNVTAAFESDSTLFNAYMSRKSRGWKADDGSAACKGDCAKTEICQLRAGRSQDNCFVPKVGINFSKRDDGHHHGEHDECGGSVHAEIFRALARREDMLEKLQEGFLAGGHVLEPIKRAAATSSASEADGPTQTDDSCEPVSSKSTTSTTPSAKPSPSKDSGASRAPIGVLAMLGLAVLAV